MRIGLIDVDSHNFPNLALMKLSAWHKAQGDTVEWWWGFGEYDRVYMSVDAGLCPSSGRLVFAAGHHLGKAKRHAGECKGPMHKEP